MINKSSPVQLTTAYTTNQQSPKLLSNDWDSLSMGTDYALAIKKDGTLWSWGSGSNGQLGTGSMIPSSSPVQIGTSTWAQVSAGDDISLAIDSTGKLYGWGRNNFGQIGNDRPMKSNFWRSFIGNHSTMFGIRQDGSLWAWGTNANGQLGFSDTIYRSSPVQVGSSSWSFIASNGLSAGGVTVDGKLFTWGSNSVGQLGDGSTISKSSPVQVGTNTNWTKIVAPIYNTTGSVCYIALRNDNTLWSWGNGSANLTGIISSTINRSSPVQITAQDGNASWSDVFMGDSFAVALSTAKQLYTWGVGTNGKLANNDPTNNATLPLLRSSSSWTTVSAGKYHGLAIRLDGTLWSWGFNNYGQLGDGQTTSKSSPVQIGSSTNWKSIFALDYSSFALDNDDVLWAWGNNTYGQLNTGTTVNRSEPVQITGSWISIFGMSTAVGTGTMSILLDTETNPNAYGVGYIYQNVLGNPSIPNGVGVSSPVQLGVDYLELLPVQIGSSSWTQVSAGYQHVTAIRSDGSVWAWGNASSGQLGESTTFLIARSSPVQVSTTNSFTLVEAGNNYNLAIDTDKQLFAWGVNTFGQLGYPSNTDIKSWQMVSAGSQHALAIDAEGKLFAWGNNNNGQLGDNTRIDKSSPTQIGTDTWIDVSVESGYAGVNSAAIRSDGALFVWGNNGSGQVGDNTGIARSSPVQIGTSSWAIVTSNSGNTVAITIDGKLFAWGLNSSGQLGLGDTAYRSSPTQIGVATNWTSVFSGSLATYATNSNKQLFAWGQNATGQIGDNTMVNRSAPVQIAGSWNNVFADGGAGYVLALNSNNYLFGWGVNTGAQLGDNTSVNKSSPVQLSGYTWKNVGLGNSGTTLGIRSDDTLWAWGTRGLLLTPQYAASSAFPYSWSSVSAGEFHSAGIRSDGRLFTWGFGTSGQLGDNSVISKSSPAQVGAASGSGHFWSSVVVAGFQTYGIRYDGTLWAWGRNQQGILADGTTTNRNSPVLISSQSWSQISAGASHVLLLHANKNLYGFGFNTYGQVTSPRTNTTITTVTLLDSGSWTSVSAGRNFSAAINLNNELYLWGLDDYEQLGIESSITWQQVLNMSSTVFYLNSINQLFGIGTNNAGQLADNTVLARSEPVQIAGSWAAVSGTQSAVSAVKTDGTLWSWGLNANGQLGDGTTVNKSSPVQILGSWSAVAAADLHTVGLRTDGTLWAWGYNGYGQLGNNSTVNRSSPIQVGSSTWKKISAYNNTIIAIDSNDKIWGFGLNTSGQLGDGSAINRSSPVQMRGFGSTGVWKEVNAYGMAIASDDTLWLWGLNSWGHLADNSTITKSSPVQLSGSWISMAGGGDSRFAVKTDGTLWAWGRNVTGALGLNDVIPRSSPVQVGFNTFTAVYDSTNTTFAKRTDNSVWGWGLNNANQLFDGTLISKSSPVQVGFGGYSESRIKIDGSWSSVTSGYSHVIAVKTDGTIWGWGSNNRYQLGLATSDTLKVTTESAGEAYLTNSGKLFTWGESTYNLYPDAVRTLTNPYLYYGADTSFLTIVKTKLRNTGTAFTILQDGTLRGWGVNTTGIIGDGTTLFRSKPVQVGVTSWSSVSAGTSHALGIQTDGSLWGWGSGTNTLGYVSWKSISSSASHVMAIRSDNTLWGWGLNNANQLGNNSTANVSVPVQIGVLSWKQVVAGNFVSFGIDINGYLYAWGEWRLGSSGWPVVPGGSYVTGQSVPRRINDSKWKTIGASGSSTFAIREDGKMFSWGRNDFGQLGQNGLANRFLLTPVNSTPQNRNVSLFSPYGFQNSYFPIYTNVGSDMLVGTSPFTVEFWFYHLGGPIGTGNTAYVIEKYDTVTGTTSWAINSDPGAGGYKIIVGGTSSGVFTILPSVWNHIALVKSGTTATCYVNGISAVSMTVASSVPEGVNQAAVAYMSRSGIMVSAYIYSPRITVGVAVYTGTFTPPIEMGLTQSAGTNIAAITTGQVKFLGFSAGEICDLSPTQARLIISNTNTQGLFEFSPKYLYDLDYIPPVTSNSWAVVSASLSHTAAIDADGKLWTTGYNDNGELGLGDTVNRSAFTQVGNSSWIAVFAGSSGQTLAITSTNTLFAWGANSFGQLGQGDLLTRSSPVQVGTSSYTQVSAGKYNSIAETITGDQFMWGDNRYGQIVTSASPENLSWKLQGQPVGFLGAAFQLDNTLWLWGLNTIGQQYTGDIVSATRSSPTQLGTIPYASVMSSSNTSGTTYAIREDGTLWATGYNGYGQLGNSSTINRSSPVQIPGTWSTAVVTSRIGAGIKSDGTLWTWGFNGNGELGSGTTLSRSSPVQVGTDSWKQIAACEPTTTFFGLRADNTLWAWGSGASGALGVGTTNRSSPVQTGLAGTSSWNFITAGTNFVLGVMSDGTLWGWGTNSGGYIGDGTTTLRLSPVLVDNGSWLSVVSQNVHTAGLKSDGTLWTWGNNASGQLGDNTIIARSSPVQLAGTFSYVTVGASTTYMVKSTGEMYAAGANANYQLGDFTVLSRSSPVQVGTTLNTVFKTPVALTGSYTQVVAGDFSVAAVSSNYESVFAWGNNSVGQVGDGTTIIRSSPVQVGTLIQYTARSNPMQLSAVSWSQVAAGIDYSVGIRADGTLWSWGTNAIGQLGDGTTTDRISMVNIGTSSWSQVSVGSSFTVAIRDDNTLWSWGNNAIGQLGVNSTTNQSSLVQISGSFSVVSAGESFVLALDSNGYLFTWGSNNAGQLGIGDTVNRSSPVQIGTDSWSFVSAGASHAMAVRDNTVYTWGYNLNTEGQLGGGYINSRSSPVAITSGIYSPSTDTATSPVQLSLGSYSSIVSGANHTMLLKSDSTLYALGSNENGQLGIDSASQSLIPTQVPSSFTQVAASGYSTRAIYNLTQDVFNWGLNTVGQLGNSTTVNRSSPVQVASTIPTSPVVPIRLSLASTPATAKMSSHATVLGTDGILWTWGVASSGQLGSNEVNNTSSPNTVGGNWQPYLASPRQISGSWTSVAAGDIHSLAISDSKHLFGWGSTAGTITSDVSWAKVSVGSSFSLAIRSDGTLWSWGLNSNGQLGVGDTVARYYPTLVNDQSWTEVSASSNFSYAVRSDGTLWSWGSNTTGQLGHNNIIHRSIPTQVGTNSDWIKVTTATAAALFLNSSGNIQATGTNSNGILGVGDTVNRSSPVQIPPGTGPWIEVAAGATHALAIDSNGMLYAWGSNANGQLGTQSTNQLLYPTQPSTVYYYWKKVYAGGSSSFGLTTQGQLFAWGQNTSYQLGDGTTINKSQPTQIGTDIWKDVEINDEAGTSAMFQRYDNTVWTTGINAAGMLSTGSISNRTIPFNVTEVNPRIDGIGGLGASFAVFLSSGGVMYTSGAASSGQLGDGSSNTNQNRSSAVQIAVNGTSSPVQLGSSTWEEVSAGYDVSFAIRNDNSLWSWGANDKSQTGTSPEKMYVSSPTQVGSTANTTKTTTGGPASGKISNS